MVLSVDLGGVQNLMMTIIAICATLFLAVSVHSNMAVAANISQVVSQPTVIENCSLQIDGVIEKGDAAKLEVLLAELVGKTDNFEQINKAIKLDSDKQFVICLSGPGGNYLEGIRIARVIAKHFITTSVPDRKSCLSACAVAFLGGRGWNESSGKHIPTRYIFPGSTVGFHAPILAVPSGKYDQSDVNAAYGIALEAIYNIRQFADELSISQVLIAEITEHRRDNYYYIQTLDDAELNGIRLTGFRQRKLKRDTFQAGCLNAFNWYHIGPQIPNPDYAGGLTPQTDQEWKQIFNNVGEYGNKFLRNGSVYEFGIWDGEIGCAIRRVNTGANIMYNVVLAESDNPLSESHQHLKLLDGIFRPSILMRGNRTLESTR